MYNSSPYQQYNPYYQYQQFQQHAMQPMLPQQQVIQVNGKASVDTIQLSPNSSILVMDTSAPIVWLCVSDGLGKVTSTPYDITLHKDKQSVEAEARSAIEQRVAVLEAAIAEMEEKLNAAKPNVSRIKSKPNDAGDSADKGNE